MATWYSMLEHQPTDNDTVWARVSTFYTTPVQLVWQEGDKTFKDPVTSLVLPWYYVVRWSPL